MLDILMSETLWELLLISVTFSIFLMAFIQKVKKSKIFRYKWQICLFNFFCALAMGIPFTMMFYKKTLLEAIWVSIFGFIGAPSLYETLKSQNILAYRPASSEAPSKKEGVTLPKENEIPREDIK